jgi:hypothetical protein
MKNIVDEVGRYCAEGLFRAGEVRVQKLGADRWRAEVRLANAGRTKIADAIAHTPRQAIELAYEVCLEWWGIHGVTLPLPLDYED